MYLLKGHAHQGRVMIANGTAVPFTWAPRQGVHSMSDSSRSVESKSIGREPRATAWDLPLGTRMQPSLRKPALANVDTAVGCRLGCGASGDDMVKRLIPSG